MSLLIAAIVMFGLTLFFATLLGIAKEKLRVEEDPRIPLITEALPESFTRLNPRTPPETFQMDGTLQVLDDCGPQMTLLQADIYSGAKIGLGKERLLNNVVLPCRLMRSSRGYSLYERMDG